MLQRWPEIRWKRSTFWKAFNKQKTQKCWTHAGCNQQKLAINRLRIRRRSGDSKDSCFRDFDGGSWQETWQQNLFCGSITRAEGISCWSCTGLAWNHLQRPRFPQKRHNQRWVMGLWLWPWNKCPFFPLEVACVSASKETQQSWSNVMAMQAVLCVCVCIYIYIYIYIYHEGGVHQKHTPPGQKITKEYYIKVLRQLKDAARRKQPQLWANGDCQLHHDNAPDHSAALVQVFFFFGKASHHSVLSASLQPRFGSLWLLAFPKAEIVVERKEISDSGWH